MASDRWKIRRRVVYGTLAYCAGNVQYLIAWGADTAVNQQIAVALTGLAGAVIGAYVFGAAWDDRNVMRHRPDDSGTY